MLQWNDMKGETTMEEDEDNNLSQFDLKQKEILSEQTTKLLLQKTQSLSTSIHHLHESLRHGPLLEPLDRAGSLKSSDEQVKPNDEKTSSTSTAGARWTTFAKADMGRSKREEDPRRTERVTMLTSMGEQSKGQRRNSFRKLRGYARYKKSLKNKVEAQLNKITERHVTRTVETFSHMKTSTTDLSYRTLARVDIKSTLLLEFAQANIEIPVCENLFDYFGKLIISKHQVRIVQAIFWFVYKCNFLSSVRALDKKTKEKKEHALRRIKTQERSLVKKFISPIYIDWLKSLTRIRISSKRDRLHMYLSFATAYAVLAGYRYLCPGSRHLYTSDFRKEVFEESSRLLMSYEFSPGSIKITCAQLFPEDMDIKRDCSSTPSIEEPKAARDSKGHSQDSTKYNAKGVGELLESYLEDNTTQEESLWGSDQLSRSYTTSSLHLLRRRKYSPAVAIAQGSTQTNYNAKHVAEEHKTRMREFHALRKECREQLAREFKEVSDAENAIYNGDTANAGRVCLDLVQKHLALRPTLKQKGNGRLDWHGILEVNKTIPIAERVVAVRDALDAVKAKEERNPRTRARLMLLKHGQS